MAASPSLDIVMVACGAPKRSMGWYHCKQILDDSIKGAKLTDIVEPFFMGPHGKDTPAAKEFNDWVEKVSVGVHATIADMPKPSGPKMAVICGRTADNPKLFKQAIDHGFTHIYLEKPGAPTVDELKEMAVYAKEKKVPVFMGFNRNFSQYVREVSDFMKSTPEGAGMIMGRNDCFQTPESLDECFERNAEGMMKNMMIHEIVVLISYFGLKVDEVKEVVADETYTVRETRKGFTDFSKIKCIIKMKSGKEFTLWGDRSNGEYGELIAKSDDKELIKVVRPNEDMTSKAAELEKACPGCQPYFYLQDGEYLDLKQAVVDHVNTGAEGMPAGVPTIETAIEGLMMCELITAALGSK